MIMCSNCNKRPAVVFITSVQGNEKKNEGLCLSCARKRDIPQVAEYMNRLGITDEELDQLSDSMMGMLDGDAFEMGGSGLMPDFISNMFGGGDNSDSSDDNSSDGAKGLFRKFSPVHGLLHQKIGHQFGRTGNLGGLFPIMGIEDLPGIRIRQHHAVEIPEIAVLDLSIQIVLVMLPGIDG